MTVDLPDVLTTSQAAELLGMSTQEVTRGAREGWLPGYRVGLVWRFDRDEVLAWLKAHPASSHDPNLHRRRGLNPTNK
jgi:excisionase family DNA binding protein